MGFAENDEVWQAYLLAAYMACRSDARRSPGERHDQSGRHSDVFQRSISTSKKSELAVRRVVWDRQFLASTVVVPPDVAKHLNIDAMAVLAVIRNEAQASGKCSLPVARIAERANIGRAKARAAIRLAEGLGLIAIEETPDRKRVIVNRGVTSRC